MAISTKYKYYINGNKIIILEYNEEYNTYLTPTTDESKAILLRFTQSVGHVSSETDSLNVDKNLATAIVYYVKSRLYDRQGDLKRAELYYNKFLQYVSRSQNNKRTSFAVAIPNNDGVLK